MKDGVHLITCDRPGCGKLVGAQRVENGKVVEEEWEQGTIRNEDGTNYCSTGCEYNKDVFLTPEEVEDE